MKFVRFLKLFFILAACLFYIILLFQMDNIKSEVVKTVITAVGCILIYAFMIREFYMDLKDKRFVTRKVLIIIDAVILLAFSFLLVFNSIHFNKADTDFLWMRHSILSKAILTVSLLEGFKLILKGHWFEKDSA